MAPLGSRYDPEDRQSERQLVPSSRRASASRRWQNEDMCPCVDHRGCHVPLAKRTMDHCALAHLSTIAYNLHMMWKTAFSILANFSLMLCFNSWMMCLTDM